MMTEEETINQKNKSKEKKTKTNQPTKTNNQREKTVNKPTGTDLVGKKDRQHYQKRRKKKECQKNLT